MPSGKCQILMATQDLPKLPLSEYHTTPKYLKPCTGCDVNLTNAAKSITKKASCQSK
jgi:hypothetical protein